MTTPRLPTALTFTLALVAVTATGCDGPDDDATASPEPAPATEAQAAAPAKPAPAKPAPTEAPTRVEVAADGTEFDPPVKAEQLPPGAFMCNMMGEVHYATMEAGDGKCPVCGMKLTQRAAGAGHDHGAHDAPAGSTP